MKLTLQNVYGATLVLANIIQEQRVMPQKAKYRIARLHTKLFPEFKLIDARRDELIKAYNNPQTKVVQKATADQPEIVVEVPGEWQVPADKLPEFTAAWIEIGNEEIEIDMQPIPLSCLEMGDGKDGAIEASELITLGEMVSDT